LLAIAGVPATAFEMARVLRSSFEYYRRSQLKPLSLAAKARSLSRLLRENLPMTLQGVGGVVPIFAGVDQSTNPPEPKVFFYDPLGAEFQATGHAASGSGSGAIRSIMAYEERFGDRKPSQMDVGAAIRFSLQLLMIAAEFDSATGGVQPAAKQFATIKVVRARGIETVSEAMQAEAFGQS
jgi:proteasome beta subunit